MSVGLYDVDMALYYQTPFNLELMKYSQYYKSKNEIVTMSTSFNPSRYSTFIVRKDYPDTIFPHKMDKFDNIIYGGNSFSNGIYLPLDEKIEMQRPDKEIYNKFRFKFGQTQNLIVAFDVMMRAEHLRLSLDGRTIWPQYRKQIQLTSDTRTLFFHDIDIDKIEGAREEIVNLLNQIERGPVSGFFATKYPIIINNYDDLLFWCGLKSTGSYFNVEFRGPLEDEELYDFLKQQEIKTTPSKIDYIVTAKYKDEDDFVKRGLLKIYNQALFLRMCKTRILLKYDQNFFVDKRWERFIDFINCFVSATVRLKQDYFQKVIGSDSLVKFAKSLDETHRYPEYNLFNKQEARDLFNFVKENNEEVFRSFYDGHTVELIGGEFQNETRRN